MNCQGNHNSRRSGPAERRKEVAELDSDLLDCIEINPSGQPAATIIWLHGLGVDGHDFVPIVPELRIPDTLPIRYVFPHAPERPVTINAGMVMPAWFDILDISGLHQVNVHHILESAEHLKTLLDYELLSGISSERIVLAGFSQGGTIALHTGLRFEKKLAVLKKRGYAEGEIELIRADGTILTLWKRYRAIYDDAGQWTGIVAFNRDITERMKNN